MAKGQRSRSQVVPGGIAETLGGKRVEGQTVPGQYIDQYAVDPLDDSRVSYQTVISSNVHSYGYKPETHTLFIRFLNKDKSSWESRYAYLDVPVRTLLDFGRASSKGQFVHYRLIPGYECKGPL